MGATQARAFHDGVAFAERFFMGESEVQKALQKVCAALDADGIPYAVAGAMALNAHGYRRVTTDVDRLLTRAGLDAFKARHLGRGWVERFPGSKRMRDTEHNVKIDIVLAGDYPGDGLPKPVAFPDPAVAERAGAVAVLPVKHLVELKLASGLSNRRPHEGPRRRPGAHPPRGAPRGARRRARRLRPRRVFPHLGRHPPRRRRRLTRPGTPPPPARFPSHPPTA